MENIVFDTNALISAHLIKKSVSAQALDKTLRLGTLVFSDAPFSEFSEVLYRTKLDRYFAEGERDEIATSRSFLSQKIKPTLKIKVSRDLKDDVFLELALEANARCLVSGDPHLLDLHPFRSITIMGAADFLQNFRS